MSRRTEEWRDIPGYSGLYQASDWGRIRTFKGQGYHRPVRVDNPRIMRPTASRDKTKYYVVLKDGKKQRTTEVGRAVALAFYGNIPEGAVACHRNGNPQDNRLWNIEIRWLRQASRERMRKYAAGANRKPILKIDRSLEVLEAYPSASAAARENGFSQKAMWRYVNLKNTVSVFAPDGFLYAFDTDAWMRRSLDRAMAELDALGARYRKPETERYYDIDPEPETEIDPAAIIWEDALPVAGGGYRIQAF